MYSAQSSISSKGQVTIPKEMRDHFEIKVGQQIRFSLQNDKIIIEPVRSVTASSLAGVFSQYVKVQNPSPEHIQSVVDQAKREEYQRKLERERSS